MLLSPCESFNRIITNPIKWWDSEPQPPQSETLGLNLVGSGYSCVIALVHFSRKSQSKVTVSLKGKPSQCQLTSLLLAPKAERSVYRQSEPSSPEEEEHPEVTNHNIATKWLEAPRKFQASTQDTEGSTLKGECAWKTQFCNQLEKNSAFHFK